MAQSWLWSSKIAVKKNSTQIDNSKDIDVVMPMHNLIENANDSKVSESLCQ